MEQRYNKYSHIQRLGLFQYLQSHGTTMEQLEQFPNTI